MLTGCDLRVLPMTGYKSSLFAEKLIREFEDKGFVESFSNYYFLGILRERYNRCFKIFDAGRRISVGGLAKYGAYEIFGKRLAYFYDKRREGEFADFLVDKFYTHNKEPGQDMQRSFTRILHTHGLCWSGCVAHNRPIDVRKFKDDIIKKWR